MKTITNEKEQPKFELPKIPSQLIRIALEDMKATIAQGIKIDMRVWGSGSLIDKKDCSVCFAGSVMLQRTRVGENPTLFNLKDENKAQYLFLDSIRQGHLYRAMEELNIQFKKPSEDPIIIFDWVIQIPNWVEYSQETQEAFFIQVEKLADMLEEKGF